MSDNISFWSGVTKADGSFLTLKEQLMFCKDFNDMLVTSPELAKIFFNTQVYNEIVNDVTTRGEHSKGVAIVAERLASLKAKYDGKSDVEIEIAGALAMSLGYMHDLGHTPFGHDGEGALGTEMERFTATEDYKNKRKLLFGEKYTKDAKDEKAQTMCYEHNETSSIIGEALLRRFAERNGFQISDESMQYIKTGILAHSTSRVETEPDGLEQKSVRLSDKIAYIPQDLLDLLKQGVLHIDSLTEEEQGLIGLNEKMRPDEAEEILELKRTLRELDKAPEEIKMNSFRQMDTLVGKMQGEIAAECFVERNGEKVLDGRKETIDRIAKAVNKGEVPMPPNLPLSESEEKGVKLFRAMRYAQKGVIAGPDGKEIPANMTPEEQREAIKATSEAYRTFLQNEFGMNEIIATLWVTKAKYQDSFIEGELKRENPDGTKEKLSDINKRNDNSWKMKSTFQYFYCNPDLIPKDFREKYDGRYTEQQIVSAFIASFTNKGLNELYGGLVERGLVISRDDAIKQLKEARPDLDVDAILAKDMKWKDPPDSKGVEKKHKVVSNDVLEYLYEENVGRPIVAGKSIEPETRKIPQISEEIAVRDTVEASRDKSISRPECLASLLGVSKEEVNSQDIQRMVQTVRDRQNTQEIQKHISEVESELERG